MLPWPPMVWMDSRRRRSLHPDLVLSDIIMPRMDGYELCRAIRDDPALSRTRVVLLTAQGDMDDVIKGLEAGADNYVTKPYDTKRLLETCEAILAECESRRGVECPCQAFPPLAVDEAHVAIRSSRKQILNFFVSMYRDALTRHN